MSALLLYRNLHNCTELFVANGCSRAELAEWLDEAESKLLQKSNESSSCDKEPNPDKKEPSGAESGDLETTADGHSVQRVNHELETAIRESNAEAVAQEGADVQAALLRSKVESAQGQVLVILRLTKRNSHVLDALLKCQKLQGIQAHVEEAGCEILPEWAGGGVVLAPLTEQQAEEAGVKLRAHHIVVAQHHKELVEAALAAIPNRRRPGVQIASTDYLGGDVATASSTGPSRSDPLTSPPYQAALNEWDGCWVVERTFVHCLLPRSEGSRSVHSEPWGGVVDSRPLKLPRLSGKDEDKTGID